jgi:ribosomal protein S18 acetylase RimI-like enzyme
MALEFRTTTAGVDWERVAGLLQHFHLSEDDAATQKKIFEASTVVVFAYDGDQLVGCGRGLSDGLRQAAFFNIALDEAYHGRQEGRALVEALKAQVAGCTITLYTHPKTVGLYERLGFRRQKTGFVLFNQGPEKLQWFEEVGFLLPVGHRFPETESAPSR